MPVFEDSELKRVLQSLDRPENLDDHPWTRARFVAARNGGGGSPGRRLLTALVYEFQQAHPALPAADRGRLHTRWLQYGILAARYFAPSLDGKPMPPALVDAWPQVNAAVRRLVPTAGDVTTPQDQPPLSTLSDWHTRGLKQFAAHLTAREKAFATRRPAPRRRQLVLVAAAALLVLIAGLAWKAARLHDILQSVYRQAAALSGLAGGEPTLADLESLNAALPALQADLDRLDVELHPLLPLAPALDWLPTYGPTLAAAEPLLAYGRHLLNSVEAALTGGQSLLDALYGGAEGLTVADLLVRGLAGDPHFAHAQQELALAQAARQQFDSPSLLPEVARQVARLDEASVQLADGLVVARALPQLLGAGDYGPQTYLVLMQNEDELRATGGFITGLGLVTLQDGKVLSFQFEDSPDVDNPDLPYNRLPWQMVDYMDGGVWLMRDANWSPDYPQVARFAETLYAYSRLHAVDGVVALNQESIARLLNVLGPVEAGGVTVSAADVVPILREQKYVYRDLYGGDQRKEFLGVLGEAMLARLQQDSELSLTELAQTVAELLREKHILVQVDQPELTALLARRNLDGALRPIAGSDFLMVVESNLGFNKVNAATQTRLSYIVDLRDPAAPRAEFRTAVTNTNTRVIECHQIQSLEGTGYQPLIEQCYWNYLRVYTAADARLLAFEAQAISRDWLLTGIALPPQVDVLGRLDGGYGFGTLLVVPPGVTREASLTLALPGDVLQLSPDGWRYTLRIQKQPGTVGVPLMLTLLLPEGSGDPDASLPLTLLGPGRWQAELELRTDQDILVSFGAD